MRGVNSNNDWQTPSSNITAILYAFQNRLGRVQTAAAWQYRTESSKHNLARESATLQFSPEIF